MTRWEWVLVTVDGATTYRNLGPKAACAAVEVDLESDTVEGYCPYFVEFRPAWT